MSGTIVNQKNPSGPRRGERRSDVQRGFAVDRRLTSLKLTETTRRCGRLPSHQSSRSMLDAHNSQIHTDRSRKIPREVEPLKPTHFQRPCPLCPRHHRAESGTEQIFPVRPRRPIVVNQSDDKLPKEPPAKPTKVFFKTIHRRIELHPLWKTTVSDVDHHANEKPRSPRLPRSGGVQFSLGVRIVDQSNANRQTSEHGTKIVAAVNSTKKQKA